MTFRFLLAVASLVLASAATAAPAGPEPKATPQVARPDIVLGRPDAPVTVIEYASTTCPHCAHFHADVFPIIKRKYIDTGEVRFIYREFPTAPAQLSYVGSILARCAADKGGPDAYFKVLEGLFSNQQPADPARSWITGPDPKAELMRIVAPAGIDAAGFDACIKRQDLVDLINANVEDGRKTYGISSTPSFVIDGEAVELKKWEDLEAGILAAKAASGKR